MRYDALLRKLKALEDRYESDVSRLLSDTHKQDSETKARILKSAAVPTKQHWTQTPAGKRKLAKALRKHWKTKRSK